MRQHGWGWLVALPIVVGACLQDPQAKDPGRQVLARVGNSTIVVAELKRELRRFRLDDEEGVQTASTDAVQRRTLLETMIDERLVLRAAEAANVLVTIDEVEHAFGKLRGGWQEEQFQKALSDRDLTATELKNELRDLLTVKRYFRDHVFARVAVTDDEIDARLAREPERALQPEQVRARQIVVKTEEVANQIALQVANGMPFEDAATKYSLSPEGKAGGDLGYFGRGTMPKVFDEICFNLPPGQVSRVVASDYGFHLFKVLERRPAQARPVQQVRDELESLIRREKEREAQKQKLAELRSRTQIEIRDEVLAHVL